MPTTISFQNEHIIYENEVRCIVRESDFNLSYNPSLLKYGPQPLINVSSVLEEQEITGGFFSLYYYSQKTTFSAPSIYEDIEIEYNIRYFVDILSEIRNVSGSIVIPVGQTITVTDSLPGALFPINPNDINVLSTAIISSTNNIHKQYEVLDSTVKDFATGSFFQPYVTTIGLYNDNNELLMVAKLAKPIALSSDTDMTFIVRYDT